MTKKCQHCGEILTQRDNEATRDYRKRITCGRYCATAMPRNCAPSDDDDWSDIMSFLREEGVFDLHGPVRVLSKSEVEALQNVYK